MITSNTQLKALALLFIFVLGVVALENKETVSAMVVGEQQTANIFSPVAEFLGIQTGESNTSSSGDYVNSADNFFQNITDPLNSGTTQTSQTTVNTPSGTIYTSNTNQTGSTNSALSSRSPALICIPPIIGISEETILMWACRDGAYTAEGENFDAEGALFGTIRVQPTEDTTYTLECINDISDTSNTGTSCVVNVAEPVLNFSTDTSSVAYGDPVNLTWDTVDTNSCLLTSDTHIGFTRRGTSGEVTTPGIVRDTTFTLTCESESGLLKKEELKINAN